MYSDYRLQPKRVRRADGSVAYFSPPGKLVLGAIGCLLLEAFSVWMTVEWWGGKFGAWVWVFAAVATVVFLSAAGVFALRLAAATPVLLVTADSVVISTAPWFRRRTIPIKWIDHVALCPGILGSGMIALVWREDSPPARKGRRAERFLQSDRPVGMPPAVMIPQTFLPTPLHALAEELAEFLRCPLLELRLK